MAAEPRAQPLAQPADVREQAVALDDADRGEAGRRRDRVAAERGAVLPAAEQRRRCSGPKAMSAPTGKPPPSPFATRHRVGHDPAADVRVLVREPRARAAHAGLHLVEDQQRAVLAR